MVAPPVSLPSYLMPMDSPPRAAEPGSKTLLPEPLPAFLMRLMTQVEALRGATRVALLHPNGNELAALLIESGKICYVERSLVGAEATALLAQEDPQVPALIGRLTHAAQGRFTTLSSLLHDLPHALRGRVREYLLSHAVRAILGLAWEAAGTTIELRPTAHYSGSFDSELSFFPLEVYLRAVQTLNLRPPDRASSLFEELAPSFDLALILEQETDGAYYPLALVAPEDQDRLLRLTDLASRLVGLEHSPLPAQFEGFSARLNAHSCPEGCWLMIPAPRRRYWFYLEGADALFRALAIVVPRLEAERRTPTEPWT